MQIIPGILERNLNDIKIKMSEMAGYVPMVQVDFCDGIFVESKTWPYVNGGFDVDIDAKHILVSEEGLPYIEEIKFEADLMIANPLQDMPSILALGPSRVIVHLDSLKDIKDILKIKEKIPSGFVELGVGVSHLYDISKLEKIVDSIDFIQVMGIDHIGVQGEHFDKKVLEKVKEIKNKYGDISVSVDGGVNLENIKSLNSSGVDNAVVGSAIFHTKDWVQSLNDLKDNI